VLCRNTAARITGKTIGEREKYTELETGVTIDCVVEFCYLGDMLGSGDGAEEASRMRVKYGWEKIQGTLSYIDSERSVLEIEGKDL
jgi:hypothetical protein